MEINCNQFEGLLSFYLNGELTENMTTAVEEHMKTCPTCSMRYNIVNSIIEDIKSAYNDILTNKNFEYDYLDCIEPEYEISETITDEEIKNTELSAYIDNELPEEESLKLRRNIIAKPKLRNKVEKLYGLKKILSNSYKSNRSRLKTDYSKDIIKIINTNKQERQVYLHCIGFVFFVVLIITLSVMSLLHLL